MDIRTQPVGRLGQFLAGAVLTAMGSGAVLIGSGRSTETIAIHLAVSALMGGVLGLLILGRLSRQEQRDKGS